MCYRGSGSGSGSGRGRGRGRGSGRFGGGGGGGGGGGFSRGHVQCGDPGPGRRKVEAEQFLQKGMRVVVHYMIVVTANIIKAC